MEITIQKLTKELIDDFLYFFDTIAFTDNKEWDGCYCCFYHFKSKEWEQQSKEKNRQAAMKFIGEGTMKGYLAYHEGKPVGWANVNDKINYSLLTEDPNLWEKSAEKTGSIVCFLIAPDYRGKGIASRLLTTILDDYHKAGYDYLEAYPRKGELSCAEQYHGPFKMYEKAGFLLYKQLEEYDIVRKQLN
jgi:GNAT superfamily N-acetyltransferase